MKKMVLIVLVVAMLAVLMVGCQTASKDSDAELIKQLQEENAKLKAENEELEAEAESLPAYRVGIKRNGYIWSVMGSAFFTENDLLKIAEIEYNKLDDCKAVFMHSPGAKRIMISGESDYDHDHFIGTYEMQDGKMVKDD